MMNTALVKPTGPRQIAMAADRDNGPSRLLVAFLARRSESTRRAYRADLGDFAAWLELTEIPEALAYLISRGAGPANELVFSYKAALCGRKLSAGTVNRRLSTLRSAVKMARTVGMCNFSIEVESERAEGYRDTKGPDVAKIRGLVGQLTAKADRGSRQGRRDLAIVRLLFNLGLRRGEVVGLDLCHYDAEQKRLSIQGKGRAERQWMELEKAPKVRASLEAWLAERGDAPGPLFVQCDRLAARRQGDGRLSATSLWRMLRKFGIRPHALRHSAITLVADRNGGDVFKTMAFSRHKSPSVVVRYVDNLEDSAGDMAGLLEPIA